MIEREIPVTHRVRYAVGAAAERLRAHALDAVSRRVPPRPETERVLNESPVIHAMRQG